MNVKKFGRRGIAATTAASILTAICLLGVACPGAEAGKSEMGQEV